MAGKLRLNVLAFVGDSSQVVGKFLVVLDEEATIDRLRKKIDDALRKRGLFTECEAILNASEAEVPDDEQLGDMFRDEEDVLARLPAVASPAASRQSSKLSARPAVTNPAFALAPCEPVAHEPVAHAPAAAPVVHVSMEPMVKEPGSKHSIVPVHASITLPPEVMRPAPKTKSLQEMLRQSEREAEEETSDEDEVDPPARVLGRHPVPGPMEQFEVDQRCLPTEHIQVDHPSETFQLNTYDNDWLVENFTPRLREHVMERLQGDLITEPKYVPALGKFVGSKFLQESGAFVSVFMRPQGTLGSDRNTTMPVHYNIPRGDIAAFQRKAEGHIDNRQHHLALFRAALSRLMALIARGRQDDDLIEDILPHTYDAFQEVEGVMMEIDRPLLPLGQTGGSCPVVVVDTAGGVGAHLTYVKAALKRALHAQVTAKSSFQLMRFHPATGDPIPWCKTMAKPNEEALQAAEDWIDRLAPSSSGNLLAAVYYALAFHECDEIFIVSSGGSMNSQEQGKVLADIKRLNVREVPIHTVAVNPEGQGELLLRYIAESNYGDFNHKCFDKAGGTSSGGGDMISGRDSRWTSWRTNLVNETTKEMIDRFKSHRMSIRGQIRIIEVMLREETMKEAAWREEWQCAQRLLLSQEDEKARDLGRDAVKDLERRSSRTLSARVGGGYMYMNGERQLGMEHLFEHKSAVPWTDASETVAAGPRVPKPDAGQARQPRLQLESTFPTLPPPSGLAAPAPLPTASAPLPDRRPPRATSSSATAGGRQRPRSAAGSLGGGSSWSEGDRGAGQLPSVSRGSSVLLAQAQNPWTASAPAGADRTKRPPSASKRGRGGSRARMASADRAAGAGAGAGSRGSSPASRGSTARSKGRSKTPPQKRERQQARRPAPAPLAPAAPAAPAAEEEPQTPPGLERRWSF